MLQWVHAGLKQAGALLSLGGAEIMDREDFKEQNLTKL